MILTLSKTFKPARRRLRKILLSGTKELQYLLHKVISSSRLSYIVIDALDECEKHEHNLVFNILQSINISKRPKAKLFLSSRESIAGEIENRFASPLHVSMNAAVAQSDIAIYIEETLEERVRSRNLVVGNNRLSHEVQDALTKGAQGMFVTSIPEIRLPVLTLLGSFGWLSRLRTSAPNVTMMTSAEHSESFPKI